MKPRVGMLRPLGTLTLLTTAALAAFAISSTYAHTDRYVQFRPMHTSGKCIDVSGGSVANGALLIQWGCHAGANQDVTFTDVGGGYHEIRFRHSGKCLDVPNASTDNGIQLQQFTCNGSTAQRFTVANTGQAGQIRNQNSGKCLDVEWASTANGAKIIQWPCHGGANQQFLVSDTYAVVLAPAAGRWAQSIPPCPSNPDPACHHLTSCEPLVQGDYNSFSNSGACNNGQYPNVGGDWAIDYYASEGSWVTFGAVGVGTPGANVTAQVWAITNTCSSVSRANGGATVFVDVYTNGYWEGWYAFGHLNNVIVQPGQWITGGTALGQTKWWTNAGDCYQVSTSSGVHTHVEVYNADHPSFWDGYACYLRYNFNQNLNSSFALGYMGRTIYGSLRTQC